VTVNEVAGTATFTVSLSAASGLGVSFHYATANGTATAGQDYTATSGSGSIVAGSTSTTVTVTILEDALDEPNETFSVNLSNPVNATIADGTGVGTIVDNDATPTLSINDVTVTEGNAGTVNAVFTVTLSAASGQTVTVDWATANDTAVAPTDYTAVSGTLTFTPGETTKAVTVAVRGDLIVELNERYLVQLSSLVNATIGDGEGYGTILNDDSATFRINDVTQAENAGAMTFTVSLSNPVDTQVTVVATTADDTARTSDNDYTSKTATLTFAAGATSQTFIVAVTGDSKVELDEAFQVNLSGASVASRSVTIGDAQGIGQIINDDTATVSIVANIAEATEPDEDGQFTVSMTASSELATVVSYVVTGTATEGVDYVSLVPHEVTIAAGATSATIDIDVLADSIFDNDETVVITLDSVLAGVTNAINIAAPPDHSATVTIKDPTVTIIDNHDPGFEDWGFLRFEGMGYLADWAYGGNNFAPEFATWTFDVLPGDYRVSVTWPNYPTAPKATNAPFSVYDGTTADPLLATVLIDQSGFPQADVIEGGFLFEDLDNGTNQGIYEATGNKLTIELTDAGIKGLVFADAVRIERLLPLHAEAMAAAQTPAELGVSYSDVAPRVQRAVETWAIADRNAQGRLSSVDVVIGQLPGSVLGLASEATSTIWVDGNGAGGGWQMDGGSLRGGDTALSSGHFDLFTAIAHELGHLLGYDDLDPLVHPNAMMASRLSPGATRLPKSMGSEALPSELASQAAQDACFFDFARISHSDHGGSLGLLERAGFLQGDEGSERSLRSISKPDPLQGNKAEMPVPYRCQSASDAVVGREDEASVDEFFGQIDDELLRPAVGVDDHS